MKKGKVGAGKMDEIDYELEKIARLGYGEGVLSCSGVYT